MVAKPGKLEVSWREGEKEKKKKKLEVEERRLAGEDLGRKGMTCLTTPPHPSQKTPSDKLGHPDT